MSLDALTWAFDQKLPCAKKMVLVALGDQANHDDECWPSQGYLAERCGLSRAHVNTILGELEADGFLYISSRSRKNGADTSNLYILAVPADPREAAAPGEGPREVAGCVYVLADGDRCKIGITRHLERRLRALESATGKPLKVVGTINCGMRKARNLETAAHDHFQDLRQKGEWFEVQGVVALEWIEAKAGEVVSTELTPPVSTTPTPGVAQADTPVSATSTPVSTEPSVFNRSGEPKVAGATPQSSLPGFDPPKPPPSKPKTGKGKKTQPGGVDPAVLTAAIAAYNAAALRLGWAECMNPHEERQRRLGARLVEGGRSEERR